MITDSLTLEAEDANIYRLSNPDAITVEPMYSGPHITFPMTYSQLQSLIQAIKSKKVYSERIVWNQIGILEF